MKTMGWTALAAATCLALTACGGESTGADGDGPDSGDNGTTTTLTGEDGEQAIVRTGEDLDVEFPDGFALVPGGKVLNTNEFSDDDRDTLMIRFEAPQSIEELAEIYEAQAVMAGYDIRYTGVRFDIHRVDGPHPDGGDFTFESMKSAKGQNVGSLTVNRK